MLGITIFNFIAGPNENSMYNTLQNVWVQELENKTQKGVKE